MRKLQALLCLCLALPALATNDSSEWGDSGINGPKYADILKGMDRVAAEYPELVQVVEYGKSVKGKPLKLMLVMKPGRWTQRPTFVMTGSTHGNEYLNIEDRLPEELLKKSKREGAVASYLAHGGAFVFVPILNPDGFDSRIRENAHGVDLNRDWDVPPAGFKGFKEVETRALADKLEALSGRGTGLKYRVTVDYHCCIGAVLYPWSYKKENLTDTDTASHQALGDIANKTLKIDVGTTGDVLGYNPVGTTKDYYYVRYGANAFTYEGRYRKENEYLPQHVAWWEGMVDLVAHEREKPLFSMSKKKANPFQRLAD